MTFKQSLGRFLLPKMPVSRHVFNHMRGELNAIFVRILHQLHPAYIIKIRKLKLKRDVLLNVGCGPYGQAGWVNLDLFKLDQVTLRSDCRRGFPISDAACAGIHVEHYFEHLTHEEEVPAFLAECRRCLAKGGVLRIIVPDAERFARAYAEDGWAAMDALAADGSSAQAHFETKMQALTHVMVQDYEHFGGYDFETLYLSLNKAGLNGIVRCTFREGRFPGGCIDRDQHRPYSLYVEATK
jgi:predicted SAM-dependent methyltransferase